MVSWPNVCSGPASKDRKNAVFALAPIPGFLTWPPEFGGFGRDPWKRSQSLSTWCFHWAIIPSYFSNSNYVNLLTVCAHMCVCMCTHVYALISHGALVGMSSLLPHRFLGSNSGLQALVHPLSHEAASSYGCFKLFPCALVRVLLL